MNPLQLLNFAGWSGDVKSVAILVGVYALAGVIDWGLGCLMAVRAHAFEWSQVDRQLATFFTARWLPFTALGVAQIVSLTSFGAILGGVVGGGAFAAAATLAAGSLLSDYKTKLTSLSAGATTTSLASDAAAQLAGATVFPSGAVVIPGPTPVEIGASAPPPVS